MMTQIRIDPITHEPVIIAAGRSARPTDLKISEDKPSTDLCPFCPGNESKTPPEVDTLIRGESWVTRSFANKFPICTSEESEKVIEDGMFTTLRKKGVHQVIVDHPNHEKNFFNMEQKEFADVLITYGERIKDLKKDPSLTYILLFKNYQKQGGASLFHPHTQVIGTPFIPAGIKRELKGFQKYLQKTGRCIYCDLLHEEIGGIRQVFLTDNFTVLAPFASRFPFETWLLPRTHHADFSHLGKLEILELAGLIKKLFGSYYKILGNFPFNLYLHNVPNMDLEFNDFHWHFEMAPRINTLAGFEIGGGTMVNTVLPEDAAEGLKGGD